MVLVLWDSYKEVGQGIIHILNPPVFAVWYECIHNHLFYVAQNGSSELRLSRHRENEDRVHM